MKGQHVGVLPAGDPLYRFLADDVLNQVLGVKGSEPVFDVYGLDANGSVFRYAERRTSVDLVGKFYGNKWLHGRQSGEAELRASLMRREFENLKKARALGFVSPPHRVVRPLAVNEALNCLLLEEYAPGQDLDFYICQAILHGNEEQLNSRLTEIAWFLADLHSRSPQGTPVDRRSPIHYLDKMVHQLTTWAIVEPDEERQLIHLRDKWAEEGVLEGVDAVLIHGDATPTNFLFREEHDLAVIDLERLWSGDCAADLGRIAAELKHLFWWYAHERWASEPYIQHLYRSYGHHIPPSTDTMAAVTNRGRYYMACDLLRISRNDWLDLGYRQQLIREAQECLRV